MAQEHILKVTGMDCDGCVKAVTRAATHAVYAPKLLAPLSISSAKQAGFTVMKRVSSGEYEKQ